MTGSTILIIIALSRYTVKFKIPLKNSWICIAIQISIKIELYVDIPSFINSCEFVENFWSSLYRQNS